MYFSNTAPIMVHAQRPVKTVWSKANIENVGSNMHTCIFEPGILIPFKEAVATVYKSRIHYK
jgi:hypothetical protein